MTVGTVGTRRSKVVDLGVALHDITPGTTICLGGNVHNNVAMVAVRELVRRGARDLELIAFGQGMAADLLIGAGCVRRVHTNYIGLEHLGLAPCLRRAVQQETVEVVDWDSLGMIMALQAAASGVAFAAVPSGIEVTSWPDLSPDIYRRITDPFSQEEIYVVPALRSDVAILYASSADPFGNTRHDGFVFWDELFAQAADRVVVVCETLVTNDDIRSSPQRTSLPAYLVDAVVESKGAARPGGAPPTYAADYEELRRYRDLAQSKSGLHEYVAQMCTAPDDTPMGVTR